MTGSAMVSAWQAALDRFGQLPAVDSDAGPPALSYAEVDRQAHRLADELAGRLRTPGEPVLIGLDREPGWPVALLGCWLAGAVAVPAPPDSRLAEQLAARTAARLTIRRSARTEPLLVVGSASGAPPHSAFSPDHAYAMATSGSTGPVKLALVSQRTCAAVLAGLVDVVGIQPGEHALQVAAFTFSSSIRQLFLPLLSGARVSILSGPGFDPAKLWRLVTGHPISLLDLTPSHLRGLVALLAAEPEPPAPAALRRLLVASERLDPELLARWSRVCRTRHDLVHLWGQTETGGAVSALTIPADRWPDDPGFRSAGLPLAEPFPPFTACWPAGPDPVELLLGGLDPKDGLLGDRGLDRGRFTGLGYRTGDLFHRQPGGRLHYAGRLDQQVKLAGVRVDLAELEGQLAAVDGVAGGLACTVARPAGGRSLVVGYLPDGGADPEPGLAELVTRWRAAGLPAPRLFPLAELPLTTSGKLDRVRLAEQLTGWATSAQADPDDPLIALWQRYTDAAGPDEQRDFFAAGGDSLAMIGLLADLGRGFGVRLSPEQFQRNPTLAGLRTLLGAGRSAAGPAPAPSSSPSRATPADGPIPATAVQRGIWLAEQLDGGPSRYWLPVRLRTPVRLDRGRLADAFQQVVDRHQALRLGFAAQDSGLAVLPDRFPTAELVEDAGPADDLTRQAGLAEDGRWAEPAAAGTVTSGRLIRIKVRDEPDGSLLTLLAHHAIADRRALMTVLGELFQAYQGTGGSTPNALSYLDWLGHQAGLLAGPGRAAAAEFWRHELPAPGLVADRVGPASGWRRLSRRQSKPTGQPAGASRHARWLAALQAGLLAADLPAPELIGIDVDLRSGDQAGLVGCCVQVQPVVLARPADAAAPTGSDAALAIARMLPHAAIPIAAVVPPADRPTGDPRQPFFRYRLVYQPTDYPALSVHGRPVRYLATPPGIGEHAVTLFVRESDRQLELTLCWQSAVLDPAGAQLLLDTATQHFQAAAGEPT